MSTGPDGADWSDDWEPIEVWPDEWRAGRISTPELAVQIGDQLLDLVGRDPDEWFDDHPVEPRVLFNGEWHRWSKRLTFVGFTAEDYSTLLDSITPRLPAGVLKTAPAPSSRSSDRTPRARLYLDIDGAFSPYCLQEYDAQHLASMPATAIDQAPATGWTWKMTALGLGPTPIPVELAQHLVELNKADVEIVWNSTWQENARFLLPAVGIDDTFRAHSWDEDYGDHPKWRLVVTDLHHDPVPFVWVDDQVIDPSIWTWASSVPVPNLLVRTNGYYGITPTIWSRIADWLDSIPT